MELTSYLDQLRADLEAAAAVGDEQIRAAAARISGAIEPSARLAIMTALSDFAAEVTTTLSRTVEGVVVGARLDGRDVSVTVTEAPRDRAEPADEHSPAADRDWPADAAHLRRVVADAGGELSRTTVRLFNDLKGQAEDAAAAEGVSLNSYISRAVSDAVRSAVPRGGHRSGRRDGGRSDRRTTGFIQT